MSELGGCRRAAGFKLRGHPAAPVQGSPAAILGTLFHEGVAQAARVLLGKEALIEDEEVRFAGVPGHPDLFADGLLVDFKTVGYAMQLDKIRREGPPVRHRWQVMCYAAALIVQGRPVKRVRLDYIQRDSGEEHIWEAPFSMQDVRDAIAWLGNVRSAPLEALPRDYAPDSAYCASCPFYQPCWGHGVPERDPRSVLYLEDPDAARWLRQLADARERRAAAEADEAQAKGALDALRTVTKPGESQDIVAGDMSARIAVTKGRASLDRPKIEQDYAAAGAKPPLKYGQPTVQITLLTAADKESK